MVHSLILIGSTHGFTNDFIKQKEIINSINPEFVLSEDLENFILDSKEKFKEILNKKKISNMNSFNEVENLIRLCSNKNIKLIGIDLPNFGFDSALQEKIKKQEKLSQEEENKIKKILEIRKKNHLKKIIEYKNKTNKPIVVIVGSWHLREDSLLMTSLDNYKIIIPCDSSGNLLIEPPEDKRVLYCEKIKNAKKIKT